MDFMKKQFLFIASLCLIFPFSAPQAFAQDSLEIQTYTETINTLDSIIIVGSISGGRIHHPVTLTVIDPSGNILFKPLVSFGGDGTFSKVLHPPISGFEPGVYTVTATQDEISETAELTFRVVGSMSQNAGILEPLQGLSISADAVQGSTLITITGVTQSREGDVTIKVTAPNGNLISVEQITPSNRGQFTLEINTGGTLWKQDGAYTVSAFQGFNSELRDSVKVEIQDGVVVPEFGSLVMIVLFVSITSIIILTSKFRNQLILKI